MHIQYAMHSWRNTFYVVPGLSDVSWLQFLIALNDGSTIAGGLVSAKVQWGTYVVTLFCKWLYIVFYLNVVNNAVVNVLSVNDVRIENCTLLCAISA